MFTNESRKNQFWYGELNRPGRLHNPSLGTVFGAFLNKNATLWPAHPVFDLFFAQLPLHCQDISAALKVLITFLPHNYNLYI